MDKGKVVGIITSNVGENNVLLQVVAFQNSGKWITDKQIIQKEFLPEEKVFGPAFYSYCNGYNPKIGSCMEFHVEDSPTAIDHDRNAHFQVAYQSKIGLKWPIIQSTVDLLDQYGAIDTQNLQYVLNDVPEYIIGLTSSFFLEYSNKLYGPFKDQRDTGNGIEPRSGKMVRCWLKTNCELVSFDNQSYLLEQPEDQLGEPVDCMRDEQLVTWLQTQIRQILDIKPYREALKNFSERLETPMLKARIEKFVTLFQQKEQSLDLLMDLANEIPAFKDAFEHQVKSFKEDLIEEKRQELESDLSRLEATYEESKTNLTEDQQRIRDEIKDTTDQYDQLLGRLDTVEKEIEYLEDNRDRLLKDFRLLLPTISSKEPVIETDQKPQSSYSINQYQATSEEETFSEEYQELLEELFENIGFTPGKGYYKKSKELMDTHRIIFVPYIQIPLAIANASGNADCIIQQVEPNWLTYHQFHESVLYQTITHCENHPDQLVFLILQDINLASPECYARPFLEVHAGIRHTFPGTDQGWPANLWVFLTLVDISAPADLGLPIARSTFGGCAGMPRKTLEGSLPKVVPKKSIAPKRLPVHFFLEHQPAVSSNLDSYFDE